MSVIWSVLGQAANGRPRGFDKLDDEARTAVLSGLAAVVILGLALIAFVWLFGRFTRRYISAASERSRRKSTPHPDDWATKPVDEDSP